MTPEQVEGLCSHLSPLLKNTIRNKIIQRQAPPKEYLYGEALLFWLADMLVGSKLVTPDQLRVILEEFKDRIIDFGSHLHRAWNTSNADNKRLPSCKVGFLDRQRVCMDGVDFFVNLTTGEREPVADNWPLETLAYNLTPLFIRYMKATSTPDLRGKHGNS